MLAYLYIDTLFCLCYGDKDCKNILGIEKFL